MTAEKQLLNDNWLLCRETESITWSCDDTLCVECVLPAKICDYFPEWSGAVWYYKRFICGETVKGEHLLLDFERVDYKCDVYLNGKFIGEHINSEERFSYDVTDMIINGENLLSLRVFSPCSCADNSEGITLSNHPNNGRSHEYYTYNNYGGILGDICLLRKPPLYIENVHIISSYDDGCVNIKVRLNGEMSESDSVTARIYDRGVLLLTQRVNASKNTEFDLYIENRRVWSPETPNLYLAEFCVCGKFGMDSAVFRFGFKKFCVENGYFRLNGKRIFLKSAHTCLCDWDSGSEREKIAQAKAMGFNCIRFLAGIASEDILDFCDELGMMVYDESAVAWGMRDNENTESQMAAYLDNMLIRDRNHTCVAIYGIFNETPANTAFDFAVKYLPKMRELDNTRLILLSSGRWDNSPDIGSLSNPYSREWQFCWGGEAPERHEKAVYEGGWDLQPYIGGMGDNHTYPTVPMSADTIDFLRNIGSNTNPVFLSECGVGTQYALYELYGEYLRHGQGDIPKANYYRIQIEKLSEFIEKFDLSNIYPTPEDFLFASIKKGAYQRRLSLDILRANPNLCGYSMTSFSCGNEGVYYAKNKYIPNVVDALHDGFAPLKWSLFTKNHCIGAYEPFTIEAVLCNEDFIPVGEYNAVFAVYGDKGVMWKKHVVFNYPSSSSDGEPPLAYQVIKECVDGLPAGEYVFEARLENTEEPTCGELPFRVIAADINLNGFTVGLCGISDNVSLYLRNRGANICDFKDVENGLILVDKIPGDILGTEIRRNLEQKVREGCSAFVLDSEFWVRRESADINSRQSFMDKTSFGNGVSGFAGKRVFYRNWLYHMDCYTASSPLFDGISGNGILDMEQLRDVYPCYYMLDTQKPFKTHCAAFGSGLFAENNCIGGLVTGEFNFGEGKYIVNTFRISENIGHNAVANRMLCNIVKEYEVSL